MTDTILDRLNGVSEGLAIKAPVRAGTTANITLSGLQTIDGVALAADDRVLVKDQTDATENGIYAASSGNWQRTKDFDGNRDAVSGTRVFVNDGTANGATLWILTTADPIVIDTTELEFDVQGSDSVAYVSDYGSDGAALIAAIATGKAVFSPASISSYTITGSANTLTFLRGTRRVSYAVPTTVNLPELTSALTTTGDLGYISESCANLSIIGADPVELTVASIASISGSSGNWSIVVNTNEDAQAAGVTAGHVLKLWEMRPLPHLSGDNSVLLGTRPVPNELSMPTVIDGSATAASGGGAVSFTSYTGSSATVTISIASPGVVTWANHGLYPGEIVSFATTGALPTGITAGTNYYILSTGYTTSSFRISATYNGSAINTSGTQSGTHTGTARALTNLYAANDLMILKGQSKPATTIATDTVNITGAWTNGIASSRAHWTMLPNSGTVGTGGSPSTTITGASSVFSSGTPSLAEANIGDLLLAEGQCRRISAIGGATSLTVTHNITLSALTPYGIITPACLHEGAFVITAVSGSQITITNTSYAKPPLYRVAGGEAQVIRTVLYNSGTGDGLVYDQGGSLQLINNICIRGSSTPTTGSAGSAGVAMTGRYSEGMTQLGGYGDFVGSDRFAIIGFGYGIFIGTGGRLQLRESAISGCRTFGIYGLEHTLIGLRSTVLQGCGNSGLQANANSLTILTEGRLVGNGAAGSAGDGGRWEVGAVLYAELPWAWGNKAMGFRAAGSKIHINEGVSCCNNASGVRFENGEGQIARLFVAGNDRAGVELVDQSRVVADDIWVTGTTTIAGSGIGVLLQQGSEMSAPNAAIVGNTIGVYADDTSKFAGNGASSLGAYFNNNLTQDVYVLKASEAILSDGDLSTLTVDEGGVAWVDGVSPAPALSGVTRVNALALDGAIVWDGAATDLRLPVTTVPQASPSQLTASVNNWQPTGYLTATAFRISADASGPWTVSGLQGGAEGRLVEFTNVGSNNILFAHNSGSSDAANRFLLSGAGTFTLTQFGSISFRYYSTDNIWRQVGGGAVGSSGAATTTTQGVVELATTAETAAGTDTARAVTPAGLAGVNGFTALTDASTIAVDLSLSRNFSVTLAGNRTLGLPTNIVPGQRGSFVITQDSSGGKTLTYNAIYKFATASGAPTLTTAADAVDRMDYLVVSTSAIHISNVNKGVA